MTRPEWLAFALILALAAGLRMAWPGVTEFKQDEAHLYGLALDLAEFKSFPLRGIGSSVGLPNAPMSVYLFALPLLVWKSPLAAALFVAGLNTASVGLGYGLARRYWGRRAALASALLYASAPWAVIYSRKIWAQNLLPLFVVGYTFSALLALVEGRRRWLVVHLALLVVIIQIHLSGLALVPLTLLLLIIFRREVDWRLAAYGVGAGALSALPLAVYVLARRADWMSYVEPARAWLARPAQISTDSFSLAAMLMQGTQVRGLAGLAAFRAFDASLPDFSPALLIVGLLILAGLGLAVWRWYEPGSTARPPATAAGLVLALWLLVPILFFVRHSTPVFSHYFILLFPAPYLLAGLALDQGLGRVRALWLLPVGLGLCQAWLVLGLLRFVSAYNTPGAFGTPLSQLLQTAAAARRIAAPEILIVGEGFDPGVDQVPAVFDVLLRGVPHRFIDGTHMAVLPAGPAAVIIWPTPQTYSWPMAALYQQWGGGQWAQAVALRAGEGEAFIAAGPVVMPPVPRPSAASALLSNGAELLGTGAEVGLWQLWWRAPGPATGQEYHLFAHLYDAGGQRRAQMDAPTYAGADWRAGDLVVSAFALPDTGLRVRAGMYAYPSLEPVDVLDAGGNPAAPWIEFPR